MARISRYPRFGHPIAPLSLYEELDLPMPSDLAVGPLAGVKLRDLDKDWWARLDRITCFALADVVLQHVGGRMGSFPPRILKRRLPQLPQGMTLDDLELEKRTYNCLARAGYLRNSAALRRATIGSVVALPNFGVKSLVDLLTSMEAVARQTNYLDVELTREAGRLRRMPQARGIRLDDLRLRRDLHILTPGNETLEALGRRLVKRTTDPRDPELIAEELRQIADAVTRLSRMTLEEELYDLTIGAGRARSRRIVARRLGWDGRGGCTLEVAGAQAGITRERVRQLAKKVTTSLNGARAFAPATRRALSHVQTAIPSLADDIESGLEHMGLTKRSFRLEGLRTAAQSLGLKADFVIVRAQGRRFAVPESMSKLPSQIVSRARRTIEELGVSTIAFIAAQVAEDAGQPTTPDLVAEVLERADGFKWLEAERGWFWLDSVKVGRNRLLNQITKILAVAERIEVGELRQGVARHYRMKGFAPPKRVLLELCGQLPGYAVTGNTVSAQPPLDWRRSLGETEAALVRVLNERGPVMRRQELEDACLALGMNRSTFFVYLDYSPILVRHAPGVYGLRGASTSPAEVEHLRSKSRPGKVLVDYGWTPDGRIWMGYRLSNSMILTGVFSVPAAFRQFIQGEFSLRTAEGQVLGKIKSAGDRAWGLGTLFRRLGGEQDDYLVLIFDLAGRQTTSLLGDTQLIDDFAQPR
jgi:hypothetical protein